MATKHWEGLHAEYLGGGTKGIIVGEGTSVYSSPDLRASKVAFLKAGIDVCVIEEVNGFYAIQDAYGMKGYVPKDAAQLMESPPPRGYLQARELSEEDAESVEAFQAARTSPGRRQALGIGALPEQLCRQKSFGEILGEALRLYGTYFWTFFAIAFVVVPFSTGFIAFTVAYPRNRLLPLPFIILSLLVDAAAYGAVALAVVGATADDMQSFVNTYKRVLPRLGHLVLAGCLVFIILAVAVVIVALALAIVLAVVAAVVRAFTGGHHLPLAAGVGLFIGLSIVVAIPILYLVVRWAFVPLAVIVDGFGPKEALSYSQELVAASLWRTVGILAGVSLLNAIVASPATAITWAVSRAVGGSLALVIGTVTFPFTAIVYTLLYFDLRSREREEQLSVADTNLSDAPSLEGDG